MAPSPLLRGLALGGQIGLSFALPLVGLAFLGRWLDQRLATFPLFFLGGVLFALVLGFILATKAVKRVAF